MAGNYPDAPSWRMAWDKDGSTGFWISRTGVVTEFTSPQKANINDEAGDSWESITVGSGSSPFYIGVVFPEPRDIDGYWLNISSGNGNTLSGFVEVSADTTNGQDGTWTSIGAWTGPSETGPAPKPLFRTAVLSTTQLNKRGIRVVQSNANSSSPRVNQIHLYGEPVPGANPNRLELWHPTFDEKLPPAYLDFGNTPRSSSEDRAFRVKNLSAVQTAGQARVAMDVLTDATPSVPAQHTLSYGGGSFLAQVNIGDLAPGAISGPVTIRRITPSNAALGLWAFRVFAESTNWT